MLLRYLVARLRHRHPSEVRYLSMGLGIEHRARTLAPFWAEHLERTRAAQGRWVELSGGEWLTVLGAGRLLDFNQPALLSCFAKLRLVDADPLCPTFWKRLPKLADAVCVDISCCLDQWIEALEQHNQPWLETLEAIRAKGTAAIPAYHAPSEGLLSLNILSQLQIVWQDGVETLLQRRFGKRFVAEHETDWLEALRPGGQMLVEQHLAAIETCRPAFVLLITDLDYLEYRGRAFRADHWAPPPVQWSPQGWHAEPGITCEVSPALEGVELNPQTFLRWLPSYRLDWQETWLWHIQPFGTENGPHGKIHRVGAFALSC